MDFNSQQNPQNQSPFLSCPPEIILEVCSYLWDVGIESIKFDRDVRHEELQAFYFLQSNYLVVCQKMTACMRRIWDVLKEENLPKFHFIAITPRDAVFHSLTEYIHQIRHTNASMQQQLTTISPT